MKVMIKIAGHKKDLLTRRFCWAPLDSLVVLFSGFEIES